MDLRKKYLILDEESNASDYLERSAEFLRKIDTDRKYLKWFTIAFHGAVYHFILLSLHKKNSQVVFEDNKINAHSLDRQLISFERAYSLLKTTSGGSYKPLKNQDACITELNSRLRNQMIHFRPTLWAAEPWYFAEVCYPLLDVLIFCINELQFRRMEKTVLIQDIESMEMILKRYIKK